MDIRDLKYLVTLAEEGSISRAAARLFMAQSSLSQFLQQYERELGTPLFVRTSKGIRPTSGGSDFIRSAGQLLSQYRRAESRLWDSVDLKGGRVTFGISSFRGNYILPRVLRSFYEIYPKVRVDIVEANSMELEEKLLEGNVDLAVVALPLVKLKAHVEPLMDDEILIMAHRSHPIMESAHLRGDGGRGWVDLKDAADHEFILSDYNTILGSMGRKMFWDKGLSFVSENTNITAAMAAAMARAGLGLAFTYGSCAEPYEDTAYLSVGETGVCLKLAVAYPPQEYRSRASLALGKLLEEQLSGRAEVQTAGPAAAKQDTEKTSGAEPFPIRLL